MKKINGNEVSSLIKKNDNIIIQEFLKDNFTACKGRHFRFVSSFDGEFICLTELLHNDSIKSNGSNGGTDINITHKYLTNSLNFSSIENKLLRKIIKNILVIHKNNFKKIFSIGWDLMFHNKNIYVLEGNLIHVVIYYKSGTKLDYDRYFNKLDEFLKIHNL